MKEITLTWDEILEGAVLGCKQRIRTVYRGGLQTYGFTGSGWSESIDGMLAEKAWAKAEGVPHVSGFRPQYQHEGDVGDVQIRSTIRGNGSLIIRPADIDTARFYLVINDLPRFRIIGWIMGGEGKQQQWLRDSLDRDPAYFVPQDALHPA